MSSEIAIKVENLSKCYQIYDKPRDRLLQMLFRGHRTFTENSGLSEMFPSKLREGKRSAS